MQDLKLESVELSNACRQGAPWRVKVRDNMPLLRTSFGEPQRNRRVAKSVAKKAASRLIERKTVKHLIILGNDNVADII